MLTDSQNLLKQWQENGLLHAAFEQLPMLQKAMVFNQSFGFCIVHLRDLLDHHTDNNSNNIPLDSFANGHRQAISHTLDELQTLYFSVTAQSSADSESTLSLATGLLSQEQQQQLKESLNTLSEGIRSDGNTPPADIVGSLNRMIAALSSNIGKG